MPLAFDHVVLALRDCTGASSWFLHDFMAKRVQLPVNAITTTHAEPISHPKLKDITFAEAQHFVDRALYHLAVGKRLIQDGSPTWGLVSLYYSSFCSAQAATRLRGVSFFRLSYDETFHRAPTYRLQAINLLTDKFEVRKAADSKGEHQRIWSAFYDSFNGFSSRAGYADVSPVTDLVEPEQRLADMHRRHLVNYVPGIAYYELGGAKALKAIVKALEQDVRGRIAEALDDPDGQLEARAFLRLRLCCGLIREIADSNGVYAKLHEDIVKTRRRLLTSLQCPKKLSRHLDAII